MICVGGSYTRILHRKSKTSLVMKLHAENFGGKLPYALQGMKKKKLPYALQGMSHSDSSSLVEIMKKYPILMKQRYCAEVYGGTKMVLPNLLLC